LAGKLSKNSCLSRKETHITRESERGVERERERETEKEREGGKVMSEDELPN